MPVNGVDRRSFLKTMGSASLSTAFPVSAVVGSPLAGVVEQIARPAQVASLAAAADCTCGDWTSRVFCNRVIP